MSNDQKIYNLIKEHQRKVDEGIYLLRKYFYYDSKHREWWQRGLEQEGDFGPKHQYHYLFHGTWCKVSVGNISIDLDYQYLNQPASFDAVKLVNFAAQIKGYDELANLKQVEVLLKFLLSKGIVKKRFPDQYYLV